KSVRLSCLSFVMCALYAFLLIYYEPPYYSDFFFSSRRRHTRSKRDWSSDVCSSDLNFRLDRDNPSANNMVNGIDGFFQIGKSHRSEERRVGKECRTGWGPND